MASEINYLAPRERTRMVQAHLANPPRQECDMKAAHADVVVYYECYREHGVIVWLPVENELRAIKICHVSSTVGDRKGAAHWFVQRIIYLCSAPILRCICLASPGLSM